MDLAARRAQAVDPATRVVAAPLEPRGEEALRQARQRQEAPARFLRDTPPDVQAEAWAQSTAMAAALPAWWQAGGTTNRDRHALGRCLVHHVGVHRQRDRAEGQGAIAWAGGSLSHPEVIRPGRPSAHRRDVDTLLRRMREGRTEGATTAPRATTLKTAGCVPPTRSRPFRQARVCQR